MSRTNPDGTYNWANEHDWGTPEQQQANIDAPDERKVTTVTRWAVMQERNLHEPFDRPEVFHGSEADARTELAEWIADLQDDAVGVGIVRIDATVTLIAEVGEDDIAISEEGDA